MSRVRAAAPPLQESEPVPAHRRDPAPGLLYRLRARPEPALLGLIALAALLIRLYHLGGDSLWIDEIRGEFGQYGLPALDEIRKSFGPLDPPLSFLVFRFAGAHLPFGLETDIRLVPALAGVAAVVCLAGLLRALLPRARALPLIAAALLAVAPFAVRYSQEARYYSLESALHLASWWLAVRLARRGRTGDWAAWVALFVVAVYTHVFAWTWFAAQAVVLLVLATPRLRERWGLRPPARLVTLAGVGIVVVGFVPWAIWEAGYWLSPASSGRDWRVGSKTLLPNAPGLSYADSLAHALFAGMAPGRSVLAVVMAVLALASVVVARGALRWVAACMLLYVVGTVELTYLLARIGGTYLAFRRFEFLVPLLLACVAITLVGGYERLASGRRWRTRVARLAVGLVVVGLVVESGRATARILDGEKTPYRAAAEAVRSAPAGTIVVIGAFDDRPDQAWDPDIRRYFAALGVRRAMLSIRALDAAQLPASGSVLWISGSPTTDPRFVSQPLRHPDRLLPIGGDRSVGTFVIPLYLLHSRYSSLAQLTSEARVVLRLPSMRAVK